WAAVARAVNHFRTTRRAIAISTMTTLREKPVGEGDGILQMLLWLGRTPESFVPGFAAADSACFRLPQVTNDQVLRWDARAIYVAVDEKRRERHLTWSEVGREIGGFTPAMLTNLSKGGRVGFPAVMRLTRWLGRPATELTRISNW